MTEILKPIIEKFCVRELINNQRIEETTEMIKHMFIMRSNMSLRNFASLITGNYVNVAMNNIKLNSKGNLKIPIAFTIIEDKQPLSM